MFFPQDDDDIGLPKAVIRFYLLRNAIVINRLFGQNLSNIKYSVRVCLFGIQYVFFFFLVRLYCIPPTGLSLWLKSNIYVKLNAINKCWQ